MYCKKCGKFIGTDADICDECKQKEALANENVLFQYSDLDQNINMNTDANANVNMNFTQPVNVPQNTSAINLGKAIAATILSVVGFIFMYVGILCCIGAPGVGVVLMMLGLAPSILGLIFGIQSIANFKQTSYIRSGKRIPVIILGISAVADAAISLLLSFILFIAATATL